MGKRRRSSLPTVRADREVLAVARNVPAANRLLDVTGLLRDDHGAPIEITYTIPPGSASGSGVERLLRDAGVERVEPWRDVASVRGRFALALAASPKGKLHRIKAPLVLMPHGAGHNRLVGTSPGDLPVASGLAPAQLLRAGRLMPTRIALSHSEQLARLRGSCPEAAERGVVVGDPTFDRMLAHEGRRDRYREFLGLRPEHRLVVISSTWNLHSLIGRQRDTVRRLLAELPLDGYRVALVAHPNVWYEHGRAQLDLWFHDEFESGLRLIPPHEGWRAALLAADVVIGDHGSVTYYAAALGRPVLLATFDDSELDPHSPRLRFGRTARRLDVTGDIAAQVDAVARATCAPMADLLIEHQGGSAERLRALMYELMERPVPATPTYYRALPDPPAYWDDITAWRVAVAITERSGTTPASAEVRRYPANAPDGNRLFVVDAENPAPRNWQNAHAWVKCRVSPERDAARWAVDRLTRYPAAEVAVAATAEGQGLLLDRAGRYLRLNSAPPRSDLAVVAGVAAAWARSGRAWQDWHDGVSVAAGSARTWVTGTLDPPGLPRLGQDGP